MTLPKLMRASVNISIATDDGYSSSEIFKSGKAVVGGESTSVAPENVLLDAFEELARLLALYGLEPSAVDRFDTVRQRVADDKRRLTEAG